MTTLISALDKSADEVSKNCANECAEIHTCTECHKKGCFCDNIEKCDRCGWAVCGECDPDGAQINDDWICGGCLDEEKAEEEDGELVDEDGELPVDDVDAPNTYPYKKCSNCEERRSCGNYNNDKVWFCEDCYDGEECFNCLAFVDMGDCRDCENADCDNRICPMCEGNFCSSCRDVIAFKCAECDIEVIKGGRAHDNAFTHDGNTWWCMDCYDAWKAHKDCPPESDNDESKCGCDSNECAECQCDTCGECTMPENKACHHAKFGKFCVCE